MAGDFLAVLRERSAERPRRVIYPEGGDPRVLDAVRTIAQGRLALTTLIGDPFAIEQGLRERGLNATAVDVLDADDADLVRRTREHVATRRAGRGDSIERLDRMARDPLMQAAAHVAVGNADGMVAGCVRTTADVVRAALTCIGLAEGTSTLSSSFHMVLAPGLQAGPDVLTFADAGVVPEPTSTQLAEIAASAAAARTSIVGDEARVAFLSYSTKGSADGPAVEKVREACALFRRLHPGIPADGELQGDAALSAEVAARKAPGSPVAGRANVLVFPDLGAANIAYKLVQYLGGAVALGPVLQGLARPCTDLSRGAVAQDIVAISCIASLMAE